MVPPRGTRPRERTDRCPGALRPWPAEDGALVRIRVPGGQLPIRALRALLAVAEEHGDRRVHVTGRANLQLRALPATGGSLPAGVVTAIETTGLLPSRRHDLVRNVLTSPQTGLAGGAADLRRVVAELDRLLLADDRLGDLPGRFLFTLDDGRGDLLDRHRDLGLVARDDSSAQLRVGEAWGPVIPLTGAPSALVGLAREFLDVRGDGPTAAWHVGELDEDVRSRWFRGSGLVDPRTSTTGRSPVEVRGAPASLETTPPPTPLPYGRVPGGCHESVETGIIGAHVARWAQVADTVVVTPWRGVLVPEEGAR